MLAVFAFDAAALIPVREPTPTKITTVKSPSATIISIRVNPHTKCDVVFLCRRDMREDVLRNGKILDNKHILEKTRDITPHCGVGVNPIDLKRIVFLILNSLFIIPNPIEPLSVRLSRW